MKAKRQAQVVLGSTSTRNAVETAIDRAKADKPWKSTKEIPPWALPSDMLNESGPGPDCPEPLNTRDHATDEVKNHPTGVKRKQERQVIPMKGKGKKKGGKGCKGKGHMM